MYEAIEKTLAALKAGGTFKPLSAAPYASVSAGIAKGELSVWDCGVCTAAAITIKAPFNAVHVQILVITPRTKDAPACMCTFIHAIGREDSLHLEALNTQLAPDSFEDLVRVKTAHPLPADHVSELNWYEKIKLPGCICRHLKPGDRETNALFADWTGAYLNHMNQAAPCDEAQKTAHARAVIDTYMLSDGGMIRQLYDLMGEDKAKGLIRKAFFPKD